jgi:hypothetical protein
MKWNDFDLIQLKSDVILPSQLLHIRFDRPDNSDDWTVGVPKTDGLKLNRITDELMKEIGFHKRCSYPCRTEKLPHFSFSRRIILSLRQKISGKRYPVKSGKCRPFCFSTSNVESTTRNKWLWQMTEENGYFGNPNKCESLNTTLMQVDMKNLANTEVDVITWIEWLQFSIPLERWGVIHFRNPEF